MNVLSLRMFNSLMVSYHTLLVPDNTIYERCKKYFEKYMCIKTTLKHNSSILRNMRLKNKILRKKNKMLEQELDRLLDSTSIQEDSDIEEKVESDYEIC